MTTAERADNRIEGAVHAVHQRLVIALLATYAVAAVFPRPGLALRAWCLSRPSIGGAVLVLNGPTLLLGLLLFNASLGVNARELHQIVERPRLAVLGLFANTAVPLVYALGAAVALALWHDANEAQNLLVGLAIVGAMPIAGSSTAWSQNASGNVALSLGLVLASTALSPVLTPIIFHAIAHVTTRDYAEDLLELGGGGTQLFLVAGVVVPSFLGLAVRATAGDERLKRLMPWVKLTNLVVLLVLTYANASAALPEVLRHPDPDFLGLLFLATTLLCLTAFAVGWGVGGLAKAETPERVSLMFALGMNNNGSGLVLAASAIADHPSVLLTIVVYNLVQQILAGAVDRLLQAKARAPDT